MPGRSRGRRPRRLPSEVRRFEFDYRELDAPLVAEMHKMIGDGRATGRTDAARAVVGRAVGTGSDASKITRLIRHYNDKLPKN